MIIKENIWLSPFNRHRQLHIYLPDDLKEGEHLPVLYMFDGHNLFYDHEATYGKSWGIKDYLDRRHSRLMVVGLECNHEGWQRLSEFTPYDYDDEEAGWITQKGQALIQWMIHDLKQYIDSKYPTLPDRKTTYIGGSSMGGLMAFYMTATCSHIYSKGICVSPYLFPTYRKLKEDIQGPICEDTTFYISWGGFEYDDHYRFARITDQNLQLIRILLKKPGVDVVPHVFKNDNHSETAWQKELHVWMEELGIG